jgi:hypothetical protein
MKKIMGLMLGLSLVLGCIAFADDATTTASTKTKKTHHKKTKASSTTASVTQ